MMTTTPQPPAISFRRIAFSVALFGLLSACAGAPDGAAPPPSGDEPALTRDYSTAHGESVTGSCEPEQTKSCSYYLPEHNGVRPCILGQQYCEDGVWGPCLENPVQPQPDGGTVFDG
jgi:hypothetical protein